MITVEDNGSGGTKMTINVSGTPINLSGDTGNQLRIGTPGYTFKDSGKRFSGCNSWRFSMGRYRLE